MESALTSSSTTTIVTRKTMHNRTAVSRIRKLNNAPRNSNIPPPHSAFYSASINRIRGYFPLNRRRSPASDPDAPGGFHLPFQREKLFHVSEEQIGALWSDGLR